MILRRVHLWTIIVFFSAPLSAQEITSFLPERIDNGAWKAVDAPRLYVGDSLFDFIDGGAAIYQEYGFRQVTARDYSDSSGHLFDAEIYEMTDPAAAFGIFSFQRGDGAQVVALGDSGVDGSYYVSFWKERYLVMVTAQDSGRETHVALLALAQQLDARLPGHGDPPSLVRQLERGIADCARVVYIRGYLGLMNQYDFGASDPFGTSEGAVVTCNGAKLVLVQAGTEQKALAAYAAAGRVLERAPRFSSFSTSGNSTQCIDRDGNHVILTTHGSYLLAAIAPEANSASSLLQRLSSLL